MQEEEHDLELYQKAKTQNIASMEQKITTQESNIKLCESKLIEMNVKESLLKNIVEDVEDTGTEEPTKQEKATYQQFRAQIDKLYEMVDG